VPVHSVFSALAGGRSASFAEQLAFALDRPVRRSARLATDNLAERVGWLRQDPALLAGVRVVVYDGKHHDVDSKEVAFIAAGKRAFMDAVSKARAIILEPVVNIEITAPEAATAVATDAAVIWSGISAMT